MWNNRTNRLPRSAFSDSFRAMKISNHYTTTGAVLLAGLFTFALTGPAFSEDAPAEKSQVLLQKVKQRELDRQIAAKQTECDRLKEDLDKGHKDAEGLQQTIEATTSLITESSENLDKLTDERKRLEQTYNLTLARIEAERRKIEGLRNLSGAQGKSLEALTKRIEETDVRSRVRAAEMQMLTQGKSLASEEGEGHTELSKLRKVLATSELKTSAEEKLARDAMKAASSKLQVADVAAARAKRMADQIEANADAPEPVAEKPAEVKTAAKTNNTAPKQ